MSNDHLKPGEMYTFPRRGGKSLLQNLLNQTEIEMSEELRTTVNFLNVKDADDNPCPKCGAGPSNDKYCDNAFTPWGEFSDTQDGGFRGPRNRLISKECATCGHVRYLRPLDWTVDEQQKMNTLMELLRAKDKAAEAFEKALLP